MRLQVLKEYIQVPWILLECGYWMMTAFINNMINRYYLWRTKRYKYEIEKYKYRIKSLRACSQHTENTIKSHLANQAGRDDHEHNFKTEKESQ